MKTNLWEKIWISHIQIYININWTCLLDDFCIIFFDWNVDFSEHSLNYKYINDRAVSDLFSPSFLVDFIWLNTAVDNWLYNPNWAMPISMRYFTVKKRKRAIRMVPVPHPLVYYRLRQGPVLGSTSFKYPPIKWLFWCYSTTTIS